MFDRWFNDEFRSSVSRVLRVRGPSGAGKSAACAQLCTSSGGRVLAWHFCDAGDAQSVLPAVALRSLAFKLATKFPAYFHAVTEALHTLGTCDVH